MFSQVGSRVNSVLRRAASHWVRGQENRSLVVSAFHCSTIFSFESSSSKKWQKEETMAEPTYDELKARLEELEKKGARRGGELDFKVGEKGGVSVYGLGRCWKLRRNCASFWKKTKAG
jgi:hypothetical protein